MLEAGVPYAAILFVCGHTRASGERISCGQAGVDIREALKRRVKEAGLAGRVRVCGAGCLDVCESGPNAMIFYPASGRSRWLKNITAADLDALVAQLNNLV